MSKSIQLTILLSLLLLTLAPAFAQDTANHIQQNEKIRRPNIVKINSLAILFGNVSLVYERGIMPRLSAGIGFGYKYSGPAPKAILDNSETFSVSMDRITGITITPEARYYIRACDPGKLEGFYAGLYFRYTNYGTDGNFSYLTSSNILEKYTAELSLRELGAGIQLGYQLIIKERFSIDFLFIGPRFSNYQFKYSFNSPPTQEFLDDLSDYLNDVIDRFGFDYNVQIEQEGAASATSSFSFANVRFGLSLGYTF